MKKIILFLLAVQCVVFAVDIDSLTPDSKYYAQTIIAQDESNRAIVDELYEKGLLSEFGNMNLSWNADYMSETERVFPLKERVKLFLLDKKLSDRWRSSDLIKGGPYYIRLNGKFYENPSEIDIDSTDPNSEIYLFSKEMFSNAEKFKKIAKFSEENNIDSLLTENIYLDSPDNPDEIIADVKTGTYLDYYNKGYNLISTEKFSKSYALYKKLLSDKNYSEGDIRTILDMKTKIDKMEAYEKIAKSDLKDKPYQLKKLLYEGRK